MSDLDESWYVSRGRWVNSCHSQSQDQGHRGPKIVKYGPTSEFLILSRGSVTWHRTWAKCSEMSKMLSTTVKFLPTIKVKVEVNVLGVRNLSNMTSHQTVRHRLGQGMRRNVFILWAYWDPLQVVKEPKFSISPRGHVTPNLIIFTKSTKCNVHFVAQRMNGMTLTQIQGQDEGHGILKFTKYGTTQNR